MNQMHGTIHMGWNEVEITNAHRGEKEDDVIIDLALDSGDVIRMLYELGEECQEGDNDACAAFQVLYTACRVPRDSSPELHDLIGLKLLALVVDPKLPHPVWFEPADANMASAMAA